MATKWPIEIISVDSALVYRGMDIGTAKPSISIRRDIPHHLIDIRDPLVAYSAAEFREDAITLVDEIRDRGRIPCLVGGTMLYLRALKQGIAELPSADPAVRRRLTERAGRLGWQALHDTLARVDPVSAARINPNDPQRLQRALEVYEITGRSLTWHHQQGAESCPFELLELAILPERPLLHQRIAARFQQMLDEGFVDEVRALADRADLDSELPSMKSVGYRQVLAYLSSEYDYQTMVEKAIVATRRLAKHQYTWLNSWQGLHKLAQPELDQALKIDAVASILGGGG